jgi:hypothetical protein
MNESLLQFLWKHQLLGASLMHTDQGQSLEILDPGVWNRHAGPDFNDVRVSIDGVEWVGNVEVHVRSSEWYQHQHHSDPSYNNVILHVVLENDRLAYTESGRLLETFVMNPEPKHVDQYASLLDQKDWMRCRSQLYRLDPFHIKMWLGRILAERLGTRTTHFNAVLERNRGDLEESFYQVMARGFGFHVNGDPFERLARSIPLRVLLHSKETLLQTEALFFGQSGLLLMDLFGDSYFESLKKEYHFQQRKFDLRPIEGHAWKFLRMRPRNFPTLRIAQLAALMFQTTHLFSRVMTCKGLDEVRLVFNVEVSSYWREHYFFNRRSKTENKNMGRLAQNGLLINAVIPFMFLYGVKTGRDAFRNKALTWLETLTPENNATVREWNDGGIRADSAFYSQSLIHLKKEYCDRKRCLECDIGNKIITRNT